MEASDPANFSIEPYAQVIHQSASGNLSKGGVHPIRYDGLSLRNPLRFTLTESKTLLGSARERIGRLKQRVDEIMAIDGKLEQCRQSLESVSVSLALLGSHHPLPSLRPTKLGIRDQALLGKR